MLVRIHIGAAILGAIDYKRTFARTYASDEERLEAYSQCHLRSANRVLRALLANGGAYAPTRSHEKNIENGSFQGVFIKLGQHMASLWVRQFLALAFVLSSSAASYCRWNGRVLCVLCRTSASRRHMRMSTRFSCRIWAAHYRRFLITSTQSLSVSPVLPRCILRTIENLGRP